MTARLSTFTPTKAHYMLLNYDQKGLLSAMFTTSPSMRVYPYRSQHGSPSLNPGHNELCADHLTGGVLKVLLVNELPVSVLR